MEYYASNGSGFKLQYRDTGEEDFPIGGYGAEQTHHFSFYLSLGINTRITNSNLAIYTYGYLNDNGGDQRLSAAAYNYGLELRNQPKKLAGIGARAPSQHLHKRRARLVLFSGRQELIICTTYFTATIRMFLVLLIAALWLPSCEHNPKVVIEYGVPPRFQLSGPGTLKYFVISGPDLKRDAANRQGDGDYLQLRSDYWKLIPSERVDYKSLDEIGSIVYGEVPAGLIQVLPEHGPPPPLVEGDLYNVHLEPNDSYSFNTFFSIRDGKILAVTQK